MMTDLHWGTLTSDQKRQYKIEKYLSSEGIKFISPEAEKNYQIRAQRLVNVYNVQEPDRVPVSLPVGNLPYLLYGLTSFDSMNNYAKMTDACQMFNEQHSKELDVYVTPRQMAAFKVLELFDYKLYVWPGHGLPENAPSFQFKEGEYMLPDEYDALIRDPSDFWLRKYLPRIFGVFEPFKNTRPFTNITEIGNTNQLAVLANPQIQDSLQKMLDAGKEYKKINEETKAFSGLAASHGFPTASVVSCKAPFDLLGDTLRGTHGIMTDMYRQPDKLLKALDVIADININSVLSNPGIINTLQVNYYLHKGADGWMSRAQFEKFYWPSLRKVMNAFIQEGLIQHPFAEGAFNSRLETVNEFPKGYVTWLFDQTDMEKAKNVLGNNCCIEGNIPNSMIMTGTPAETKEYCRKLIEVCGRGGGYILASGAAAENPKLENVKAIMEAVKEYGVYK